MKDGGSVVLWTSRRVLGCPWGFLHAKIAVSRTATTHAIYKFT